MITLLQSLPATCFSSCIPDVIYSFTPSSGDIGNASRIGTTVTITIDCNEIFSERFFPIDGKITLAELDRLLTPYARQYLSINLTIKIEEDDYAWVMAVLPPSRRRSYTARQISTLLLPTSSTRIFSRC